LMFVIIILSYTLLVQIVWTIFDTLGATGKDSWSYTNLIDEFRVITIIGIACDLVAIPTDVISTYFISKKIK
jgi:hypothetical protein